MFNTIIAKLLLFFFGVQFFFYGLFAWNWVIFWLGVVNVIAVFFLFDAVSQDKAKEVFNNVFNYIRSFYNHKESNSNFFKSKDLIKNFFKKDENYENKSWIQEYPNISAFLSSLYYFNKHYIFVISLLVLILAITDSLFFQEFDISLFLSFLIFAVSFLVNIQELMNGELYFWNRKISQKDFAFIANILLIFFVYNALEWLELITKLLVSFLIWLVFYLVIVYTLWLVGHSRFFIKDAVMKLYWAIFVLLIFGYVWNTYPQVYDFFVVEREIVKYVWEEEEIEEDYILTEEIVAPNENRYQVYKDTKNDEVWFNWDDWTKLSFDNIEEAEQIIIANNPKEEFDEDLSEDRDVEEVEQNWASSIEETLSDLLDADDTEQKDKFDEIERILSTEFDSDSPLTYEYVIPYLIKNYWSLNDDLNDVWFDSIPQDEETYPYFKQAQHQRLVGTDIDPNSQVRCRNYIVMLWLILWWEVSYTSETIFENFWSKAENLWKIPDKCSPYDFITKSILKK